MTCRESLDLQIGDRVLIKTDFDPFPLDGTINDCESIRALKGEIVSLDKVYLGTENSWGEAFKAFQTDCNGREGWIWPNHIECKITHEEIENVDLFEIYA